MKYSLVIAFFLSFVFTSLASCDNATTLSSDPDAKNTNSNHIPNPAGTEMKIKIGNNTFTARLYDNATATAFKALLPLTVAMIELNGNEKYIDLPGSLPSNAANPGTIQAGDLMLYGSNTLVLFYKSFSTSYRYTKIGRINDVTGLAAAVGSGNVTVTYTLD